MLKLITLPHQKVHPSITTTTRAVVVVVAAAAAGGGKNGVMASSNHNEKVLTTHIMGGYKKAKNMKLGQNWVKSFSGFKSLKL